MKKIVLIILVIGLLFQSAVLQRNVSASGEVSINPNVEYGGYLEISSDVDIYKINITNPSSFKVEFRHKGIKATASWTIKLLTYDHQELTSFTSYNYQVLSSYSDNVRLSAGTYYIAVYCKQDFSNIDYYLKAVVTDESNGFFEKEDNDMKSNGQLLNTNVEYTGNLQDFGDIDYYKFEITNSSSLKILFRHPEIRLDASWDIRLLTNDKELITTFYSNNDQYKDIYSDNLRLSAGTYYIEVTRRGAYCNTDYNFKAIVSDETQGYFEREDNGIKSDGQLIEMNTMYTGNLNNTDDMDYYKFNITKTTKVKIQFGHINFKSHASWDIQLFTDNNKELTSFYSYNDEIVDKYSDKVLLPAGTYYVVVTHRYDYSNVDYKLKVLNENIVTSVKVNKSQLSLAKSKTYKLQATINPTNASNKNVTWRSSNSQIAKVSSNGNVSAIKKGTAYIFVTTLDGAKKDKCKVTIK